MLCEDASAWFESDTTVAEYLKEIDCAEEGYLSPVARPAGSLEFAGGLSFVEDVQAALEQLAGEVTVEILLPDALDWIVRVGLCWRPTASEAIVDRTCASQKADQGDNEQVVPHGIRIGEHDPVRHPR